MKISEILMYHGTGPNGVRGELRPPFFVTKRKFDAKWFAVNTGEKGVIVQGDLRVKNALDVTRSPTALYKICDALEIKYETNPYFYCDEISKHGHDGSNVLDLLYLPTVIEELKRRGYRMVRSYDTLENTDIFVYVLLYPNEDFHILKATKLK